MTKESYRDMKVPLFGATSYIFLYYINETLPLKLRAIFFVLYFFVLNFLKENYFF